MQFISAKIFSPHIIISFNRRQTRVRCEHFFSGMYITSVYTTTQRLKFKTYFPLIDELVDANKLFWFDKIY